MNTPTPIIARPYSQRAEVDRLIKYCAELDGTIVKAIDISRESDEAYKKARPGASFACLQAHGLRTCALEMKGKPFFWLEPDSVPLRPGWLGRLSAEYTACGKPYLWSADSNPPHDLIGGIGFYGPDTSWLFPDYFPKHGWDLWGATHLSSLIAATPAIQHSYGIYNKQGFTIPRRFVTMREREFIRPGAEIIHRDKYQDMTRPTGAHKTFAHTGDLGDIIAALPSIRELGGGDLVLFDETSGWLRKISTRFAAIAPLLRQQSYIHDVRLAASPVATDYSFRTFRENQYYNPEKLLAASQAAHIGLSSINMLPWLEAKPAVQARGRVVINRSARYHNPKFPWSKIVDYYGDRCVFVGLPDEHFTFCVEVRRPIDYVPTATLLDVAEMISGSELFIGNQSSACWIAMGLGHDLIQETWETHPNSIVRRPNAQFVADSNVELPKL